MISEKIKNDPSEIRQEFSNVNIKLLCCRYWMLQQWQCMNLSVPFWRIYHNNIDGAKIYFNGETTHLDKHTIVIIPPNTAFSTKLNKLKGFFPEENISGRKIERKDNIEEIDDVDTVDHLFIHFSLGLPLDFAQTGVYSILCTAAIQNLIEEIQLSCLEDTHFTLLECLQIKQLINVCLLSIRDNIWKVNSTDSRIFTAMQTIEGKFGEVISNALLADMANMATNSFSRLFKSETGHTVQQYITKTRIEAACNLMHHSRKNIDEIAYSCGFYDRYHFSKIFKRHMGVPPSYYIRKLTIS